jgi:endonuclease-3
MNPQKITEVFQRLETQNPHPETELYYTNPYTLLVAVMLSAQATDVGVNKATQHLFPTVDTPQKMLALGLEGLKNYVKTIGLYPTKSKNIIAMSQILIERFGGQIPRMREELESLPGVGRKTANVVLNVAFKECTFPVDTHVFRVANRLQIAPGKTPLEVEKGLEKNIPKQFCDRAHHWLILHGRYVCKARVPLCYECVLNDICPFEPKTKAPK